MSAKLYFGSGSATPTTIVEKPTPMPLTIQKVKDANGKLVNGSTFIDLTGVTDIGSYSLAYSFYKCTGLTSADLSNIETISGTYALYNCFCNCTGLTHVNLSKLKTIKNTYSLAYCFSGCTSLKTVDLSSLESVSEMNGMSSCFTGCTELTSIDLSSLQYIYVSGFTMCFYGCSKLETANLSALTSMSSQTFSQAFQNCIALKTVDLSSLTSMSGYSAAGSAFSGCIELVNIDLSSLTSINAQQGCSSMFSNCKKLSQFNFTSVKSLSAQQVFLGMFSNCTALKDIKFPSLRSTSFGSYTNQFNNMLGSGVTNCIIHFPSNIKSILENWTSVINCFGGTECVVKFDLPSTALLTGSNGNTYERNPKYDTEIILAWRINGTGVKGSTVYYTSGITDPQVGDNIYSDPECTQVVTTINAIA